ncbi:MAG: hypothetical protein WAT39_10505 [Planctomycetota bacterium]
MVSAARGATEGRGAGAFGEVLVATAVGALLLWLSTFVLPPAQVPFPGHGERFVAMARAPLAFDGEIPQRVLWPLLANLAGRVGVEPVPFSLGCSGALLAVVFWVCRRRGAAWVDALLVTAAVATSGAVLVYHTMACHSDSLFLLALLLAVQFAARPAAFWGLVLFAALAHELVFLLLPWLLHLRRWHGATWRREATWLAAVLASYAGYRMVARAIGPAGGANYGFLYYFLTSFWVPWLLPGLWALWVLVVLVEFGPLLVVVVVGLVRGEHCLGGRIGPWLYLGGVLAMMMFSYDVMRFASFVFVPLVFSAPALLGNVRRRAGFAALLVAAVGSYWWGHPVPSQQGGSVFTRVGGDMFALAAPRARPGEELMGFGDAMAVLGEAFPADAGIWALVLLGYAAVAAAGIWLARQVGTASPAGSTPRTQRSASP